MYLEQIDGPEDLKRLATEQLVHLAREIREELVRIVAANGGHLAPNLGVVELTLALHRVFDSPRDKIIWDVGHQCYVHKLVTGRRRQFASLRRYGGLSGFPKREESPTIPSIPATAAPPFPPPWGWPWPGTLREKITRWWRSSGMEP